MRAPDNTEFALWARTFIAAVEDGTVRVRIFRQCLQMCVIATLFTSSYGAALWISGTYTPRGFALHFTLAMLVAQSLAWWRYVSSLYRIKRRIFGTWQWEAGLIDEGIRAAQKKIGIPGPAEEIEKRERIERLKRFLVAKT